MESKLCLHCKFPIYFHEYECMWLHDSDRWEGDNGYWCDDVHIYSANPRTKREQELHNDGWYIQEWFEGKRCHKNAKTGEHLTEDEFNKLSGIYEEVIMEPQKLIN
jgi:hypothetical protein